MYTYSTGILLGPDTYRYVYSPLAKDYVPSSAKLLGENWANSCSVCSDSTSPLVTNTESLINTFSSGKKYSRCTNSIMIAA